MLIKALLAGTSIIVLSGCVTGEVKPDVCQEDFYSDAQEAEGFCDELILGSGRKGVA